MTAEIWCYVLSPTNGSLNTPWGDGQDEWEGRAGTRWQRWLLMKIKSGKEEWRVGERGSREMRVFVFKEEIGWPGIFLACAITVVSVATIVQKYKGPLWSWEIIVGYKLLGYVCIRKRKRQNTTAQVPSLFNCCSSMTGGRQGAAKDCMLCVWRSEGVHAPGLCSLFTHSQAFLSFSSSFCENNAGESPFSPQSGADGDKKEMGHRLKGGLFRGLFRGCWQVHARKTAETFCCLLCTEYFQFSKCSIFEQVFLKSLVKKRIIQKFRLLKPAHPGKKNQNNNIQIKSSLYSANSQEHVSRCVTFRTGLDQALNIKTLKNGYITKIYKCQKWYWKKVQHTHWIYDKEQWSSPGVWSRTTTCSDIWFLWKSESPAHTQLLSHSLWGKWAVIMWAGCG